MTQQQNMNIPITIQQVSPEVVQDDIAAAAQETADTDDTAQDAETENVLPSN